MDLRSGDMPVLYMDETNINIHISRGHGRSLAGKRCSVVSAGSKGANIHIIGAISEAGVEHMQVKRGSFKKEDAREWLKECLRRSMRRHGGPVAMIIDNAPCHSNIEEVLEDHEFRENIIVRLAPYSPMLNPIEHTWSVVKADVKRNLAARMPEILRAESNSDLSKTEYRLRELETEINRSLPLITSLLCRRNISHINNNITKAINLDDMEY